MADPGETPVHVGGLASGEEHVEHGLLGRDVLDGVPEGVGVLGVLLHHLVGGGLEEEGAEELQGKENAPLRREREIRG